MWTYIFPPLSHSKYTIIGNPKSTTSYTPPKHVLFWGSFLKSQNLKEFRLRSKFLSDVGNEVASNQTRYLKFLEPLQLGVWGPVVWNSKDYVTYVTLAFHKGILGIQTTGPQTTLFLPERLHHRKNSD